MAFQVHVETFKEYSYSGPFDFKEFIAHMKDWFERNGYDINENEYGEKNNESHKIKWECDKEIDDYHSYVMKFVFELKNFKEIVKDNKKIVNGDLKLTLEFADVKRDIEEKWQGPVSKRFARAVYDKFIMEDKESDINKQLKNEVSSLFIEIKQYFG